MSFETTASPHIRDKETTGRIMLDMVIALCPAVIAGTWFYGPRALMLTVVSVLSCVLSEWLFRLIAKQHGTITDGSAVVTGILLALVLPASVPYWIAVLGGAFAMILVKGMFGGIGQNIFNPALAARAFLLMFWPVWLVRYAAPGDYSPVFKMSADIVSAATPMHTMQMPALPESSMLDMFLGNIPGTIGEASVLALLLGGAYLLIRKVITPRIPLAYLGSVAVITLIFSRGQPHFQWMLYNLMSGGLLLGAIFMATDYSTAPATPRGQILYGVGCGVLTVAFRYTGLFPEGVTYAILLMNALAWWIDRVAAPKRFGERQGGTA